MNKRVLSVILTCAMLLLLAACGSKKNAVLYYDLPEEFVEQSDGLYLLSDYPRDTSNIFVWSGKDELTLQSTEEAFCSVVEESLAAQGMDVELNCTEFTKSELDGCKTLTVRVSYEYMGIKCEQLSFSVETSKNQVTTITYTQIGDASWMDAFEKSVASAKIEYED